MIPIDMMVVNQMIISTRYNGEYKVPTTVLEISLIGFLVNSLFWITPRAFGITKYHNARILIIYTLP